MLTTNLEDNRDFDINNLYINLDFQNHEETFEYKYPILEHPSNYQMVVTKFFSKTTLPFIKFNEAPTSEDKIEIGDTMDYDGNVYLRYNTATSLSTINYAFLVGKLQETNNSIESKTLYASGTNQNNKKVNLFEYGYNKFIYSPSQFLNLLNKAIDVVIKEFVETITKAKGSSNIFLKYYKGVVPLIKDKTCLFYYMENGKLCLRVLEDFLLLIQSDEFIRIDTKNDVTVGVIEIMFSPKISSMLKSLHLVQVNDRGNMKINISNVEWHSVKFEYDIDPNDKTKTISYRIFEGNKINMMEWSDYIGICITSPDFPIKQQLYPHFDIDYTDVLLRQNRRRYISASEAQMVKTNIVTFSDENINDLLKETQSERIIFLKYFDNDDNLNYLNYENNNISSSIKMDLLNVMPIKKFTMKIFLIDRYNNFEPLNPQRKIFEDVIKMQILFQRIKGSEKENRYIIEPKNDIEKVMTEIVEEEEDEEEEENENGNEEITEEEIIKDKLENIDLPNLELKEKLVKVDLPNLEMKEKLENVDLDEVVAPPTKKMYLEESTDSENESELY